MKMKAYIMKVYMMVFPFLIFIFLAIYLLTRTDKDEPWYWSADGLKVPILIIDDHIFSEDGYWINRYQIRGYKNTETFPGKFTIYAYVTGGSRHPIKSGFTKKEEATQWLVEFLMKSVKNDKEKN